MNKTRIAFTAILLLGTIFFLAGAFLPFLVADMADFDKEVGIFATSVPIGREFYLVTQSVLGVSSLIYYILGGFGIAIAILGLFGLIFTKTIQRCCSVKTGFSAFLLSFVGGLISMSMLWFLGDSSGHYPIVTKGIVAALLIGLVFFVFLFKTYVTARRKKPSKIGMAIDLSLFLVFLLPFVLSFHEFYHFLAYLK